MASTPRLIGICGIKGSGKSTIAKELSRAGFVAVKFAAPLKEMLRVLGLTNDHLEGRLKELPSPMLMGRTPRWAMQSLGTEWGRDLIHPELWVSQWKNIVCDVLDRGGKVVVDDLRYANELKALKEIGGHSARVERPGTEIVAHPSETTVLALPVDQIIHNTGTIEDLRGCAAQLGGFGREAA